MKNNRGFTLIEMLVVIAVIGILSATILTALGPARTKAKDTRVMAAIQSARIIMESLYINGAYETLSLTGVITDARFVGTYNEIINNGGTDFTVRSATSSYVVYATLNSDNIYCADPSQALELTAAPGVTSYVCQ